MRRAASIIVLAVTTLALTAPMALAHDGGEGWWGETNDKVVTNAGYILVAFFTVFVAVMSVLQAKLEKRKQAAKAAQKARVGRTEWRGGW